VVEIIGVVEIIELVVLDVVVEVDFAGIERITPKPTIMITMTTVTTTSTEEIPLFFLSKSFFFKLNGSKIHVSYLCHSHESSKLKQGMIESVIDQVLIVFL
jgi:hypothetical protein